MAPSAIEPWPPEKIERQAPSTLSHSILDLLINALNDAKSQVHHIPDDVALLKDVSKAALNNGTTDPKELLNMMYPQLGQSGSYYARSVVPKHVPTIPLPDPALIFDELFAHQGAACQHPASFSSMAIALATIIIHDIFHTDSQDENKVESTSYLDMGPLYGHNQKQQDSIRQFKDGLLKPDAFTEVRLLGQPPGVGALLVSFNRFHNYVARELAIINENRRFSLPTGTTPKNEERYAAAIAKQENDLFQTARLYILPIKAAQVMMLTNSNRVTCGLYVNIILNDYVHVILNLNCSETEWTLDPRKDLLNVFDGEGIPKGTGNQVSMEFNLIYRWHSTISDRNADWAADFMAKVFPGQDLQNLTQAQFLNGSRQWAMPLTLQDPGTWTIGGLKRGQDGRFADADLVRLLTEETEDCAGAFGGRNTPAVFKAIDILGIEQGRRYGAASLNELRNFFGLTSHKSFTDVNSDPSIAAALQALYTHPDNIELYPGLVVEQAKPLITNASGLCAGDTIAKGILADAVALVRGDRFYTIDNSPANLTAFGYRDIASERDSAQGVCIHKLLQHAYPGWYTGMSVYSMFPLTVPNEARKILKALGSEQEFTYDRPSLQKTPIPVTTWQGVVNVLKNQTDFKVPWGAKVSDMTHHDWMLSGDNPWNAEQESICKHAIYSPANANAEFKAVFEEITSNLIKENSSKLRGGYYLDAVRDVGNLSHAIFMAQLWYIPLTDDFTAKDLHDAFTAVFQYSFLDLDPSTSFKLRQEGRAAAAKLAEVITPAVEAVLQPGFNPRQMIQDVLGLGVKHTALHDYGAKLIKSIEVNGKDVDYIAETIVPTAAVGGPLPAQGFAMMLDFWLQDANAKLWVEVQKLAQDPSAAAFSKIRKYVLESLRISCTPAYGVFRVCASQSATIIDGSTTHVAHPGDTIFLDFLQAGTDPAKFPDPLEFKLDRPEKDYIHQGFGAHQCLGREITFISLAVQLRAFARLKNLRRAPGHAGTLLSKNILGTNFKMFLNETQDAWTPFPRTMQVIFDEL